MDALTRATYRISRGDLESLAIAKDQLPSELESLKLLREGVLDNNLMAAEGFLGETGEDLTKLGRISGYMREFINPLVRNEPKEGTVLAAATVAHLFTYEAAVANWMKEIFLKRFADRVGTAISPGQQLLSVTNLKLGRFYDQAVGIKAVQQGPSGIVSSTIIDFRLGCLLGVAFTVTLGNSSRDSSTRSLAVEMERHMVKVVLGVT